MILHALLTAHPDPYIGLIRIPFFWGKIPTYPPSITCFQLDMTSLLHVTASFASKQNSYKVPNYSLSPNFVHVPKIYTIEFPIS